MVFVSNKEDDATATDPTQHDGFVVVVNSYYYHHHHYKQQPKAAASGHSGPRRHGVERFGL